MPKKGGKGKNKKKAGASAAVAAATNKATEAVDTVDPTQEVEETVSKVESDVETAAADVVEAPTAAATTSAVPETITKTVAAAPPNFTEAASNAAKISVPSTEGEVAQDSVDKAQALKAAGILPETKAKESGLTTSAVESGTGTSAVATSLAERPKELDSTDDSQVNRPNGSSVTTEKEDDKLPKVEKVNDSAAATAPAESTTGAGKEKAVTALSEDKAAVQPQIVPGLGADPADKTSKALEVPGLTSVNSKELEPTSSVPQKLQATEATLPTVAPTYSDKLKEGTSAQEETPTVSKSSAGPTTHGISAVETVKEKVATLKNEATDAVKNTVDTAKDKAKDASASLSKKETPTMTKPSTDTTSATPAVDKTKAKEVSDTLSQAADTTKGVSGQQETPAVAKPSVAVTAPEKAIAAPSFGESGGVKTGGSATETSATKQTAPLSMPSSFHPEGKKRLSTEAPAVAAPEQTQESAAAAWASEEVKNLDTPVDQQGQTAETAVTQPEEGKAVADQAQDSVKAEAAKAEKRKSGGFWGWVKRKVKGA